MATLSQADIDEFLDENIQDNFKILSTVVAGLKNERDKLFNQLSGKSDVSTEDEETWQVAARDTRNVISQLKSLKQRCTDVRVELSTKELVRNDKEKNLILLLSDLNEMEGLRKYLLWIRKIQNLSSVVSTKLNESMDLSITAYSELVSLTKKLSTSQCHNLKEYVSTTCSNAKTLLVDKLSADTNELLKLINWPITKDTSTKSLTVWQQKRHLFANNFHYLLAIDQFEREKELDIYSLIPLPVELLLTPLRKRFKYHFYGERQTNSKEKPEWYFTQVSTWITDHSQFLEKEIQSIVSRDKTSSQHINIKVEFIRGLLQEIVKKIRFELNPDNHPNNKCILDDDYLMSHLIDELLLFERELCEIHCYPSLYPSCIVVLQDEVTLCRWLNLEKQFAVEKMKAISELPTAWTPYLEVTTSFDDLDETKAPECAEKIMQLISGITERFKQIKLLYVRLQFLELQTDLLLEFHQDLADNVSTVLSVPLMSRFSAYLNAAHYIASVLTKWGEETFYIELHYYHKQLNVSQLTSLTSNGVMQQIEALRKIDPNYAQLEGTAFETVIAAFTSLSNDMISTLISFITKLLRNSVNSYKKERWQNIPLVDDSSELEVSSTALNFLLKLQEVLHSIKSNITHTLVDDIMDKVCTAVDDVLLNQVIYSNHFSEGGAVQLHYDITRVISPLLVQYMTTPSKPEKTLHKTYSASNLLRQSSSELEIFFNYLKLALGGDEGGQSRVSSNLHEWDIYNLSMEETKKLLSLRIFT